MSNASFPGSTQASIISLALWEQVIPLLAKKGILDRETLLEMTASVATELEGRAQADGSAAGAYIRANILNKI